ncbi:MAG TPA: hypothetical protein VLL52_05430, partial [Anaerolineae bacterium]|nr:hypothetical protein [Anaerolineae bacterium]
MSDRRRWAGWLWLVLVVMGGIWWSQPGWRPAWGSGVGWGRSGGEVPIMQIDIDFETYQILLREKAAGERLGVVLAGEGWQAVEMTWGGRRLGVEVQLSEGKMVNGWPLWLRGEGLLGGGGEERVRLWPWAVGEGVGQWGWQEVLTAEGLISHQGGYVRLQINGEDEGIYWWQEEVSELMLARNRRLVGPVIRFEESDYWEAVAVRGSEEAVMADPVLGWGEGMWRYLEVVSDGGGDEADRERGVALWQGLQRGRQEAGAVFNRQQYGELMALMDWWGVVSRGPSEWGYYYNGQNGRLEPFIEQVAFEWGGSQRIKSDWLYGDEALQAAYLRTLARVSAPAYLEQLRVVMGEEAG